MDTSDAMRKSKGHRKIERLLVRYVPLYLLVLSIPLFVGGLVFLRTFAYLENEVLKNRLTFLQTVVETMDGIVKDIDRMNLVLSRDEEIQALLANEAGAGNSLSFRLIGTGRLANNLRPESPLISDIYLYPHGNGIVLRNGTVFLDVGEFRTAYFATPGMGEGEWLAQTYAEKHHRRIMKPVVYVNSGITVEVIPYLQSLPVDSPYGHSGTSVVALGKDAVLDLIGRLRLNGDGYAYVLDEKGDLVVSTDSEPVLRPPPSAGEGPGVDSVKVLGRQLSVSYMTSRYNRWTYVYVLPAKLFWSQLRDIQFWTTILLSIVLVAGIVVSLLFSYRSSRPLVELARMLRGLRPGYEPGVLDVPEFLKGSVSDLVKRNEFLTEAIEENRPFLRKAFLQRLVRGELKTVQEARALAVRASVDIEGALFCSIVCGFQGFREHMTDEELTELEVKSTMLQSIAERLLGNRGFSFAPRDGELVMIARYPEDRPLEFEAVLDSLAAALEAEAAEKAAVKIRLERGSMRHSIMETQLSYAEARRALDRGDVAGGAGAANGDCACDFPYTLETETRLLSAVEAGDGAMARSILAGLREESGTGTSFASSVRSGLETTLIRAFDRILPFESAAAFREELAAAARERGEPPEFRVLEEFFARSADRVAEKKRGKYSELTREIKEYVDVNFADPQLCLWKIASAFDLTDTYLCKLFKAHTGENLFGYIQGLRLARAKALLDEDRLTVQEISVQCGYLNVSSFRRAFKRCYGVQPSQLRG